MPETITIENHGPLIISSDFWRFPSPLEGKFYVSINAGAFRLLVPAHQECLMPEFLTGKEVVISRGPWPQARLKDAFEIMFDDRSDSPFSLHLSPESFDRLPTPEDADREWVLGVWTGPRRGKPHLAMQRPCWYRLVPSIPCLKPWPRKGAGG